MARLIDADALKERAIRVSTVKEHCYMKAVGTKEIDKAPTIDAVPVVHGHWAEDHMDYVCSNCETAFYDSIKFINPYDFKLPKFCPNCGARMDAK